MKKSLSFPFSFLFTFCFFLPVVSNLKAMDSSIQTPQPIPGLSPEQTSLGPDLEGLTQFLKTRGIPVTPHTLQAFAKYSSSFEREKLADVLSKEQRHADSLSQLILAEQTTPKDLHVAADLLNFGSSMPPNFKETSEAMARIGSSDPKNISIVSGIFDPSVKDIENDFSKNLRHAYETENRLLRTLMSKGFSLKEKQILRRRGSVVKDLPMGKAPSSFFEELFELKTDPLTTLKRLHQVSQSALSEEMALDVTDQESPHAQKLLESIEAKDSYLRRFPKDVLDRYISLMQQRKALSLNPTPSSYEKMNEIDQQILDLASQKSFRDFYVERALSSHPPRSEERGKLKKTLLEMPSSEEFSGAQWAHDQGIKGKKGSILILERLNRLTTAGSRFDVDSFLPSDLKHSLDVESLTRKVAPHADISLKNFRNIRFSSQSDIQDALAHYGLGPKFGSPSKIINFSLSSPALSRTLKILHSSGNHLFVLAAGNQGKRMEEQDLFSSPSYDPSVLDSVGDNIIFAGSLTHTFNKAAFSNFPDFFQKDSRDPYYFQNRFLFTLGSRVPLGGFSQTYDVGYGTSFSAPVISGAAALLQGAYPSFSMQDIQTILLESAEKNFMMQTSLPQAPEAYTYVYDPFDPQNKDLKESKNVTLERFDPAVFGKGVLSIRRALIYAQIYNRLKIENPTLPPEELKVLTQEEFQKFMLIEHKAKGKILLRALKKFLAQQRAARGAPSHNSPPQTKTPKKGPPTKPKPHSVPPPHAEPPKEPLPAKPTPPHSASVRDRIKHFNHMSKDS